MRLISWLEQFAIRCYGFVPKSRGIHFRQDRRIRRKLHAATERLEDRTLLAAFVVDTLADENDGVGTGGVSLRDAIEAANANAEADTITFAPALTTSGDATINLTIFDTGVNSGEVGPTAFQISTDVTIIGPSGDNGITIARDGSAADFRLFHVTATGTLALENLTLSGGVARGGDGETGVTDDSIIGFGGGGAAGLGGAIFNQGTVDILNSTLTANTAVGGDGGDMVDGSSQVRGGGGGLGSSGSGENGGGPSGGCRSRRRRG